MELAGSYHSIESMMPASQGHAQITVYARASTQKRYSLSLRIIVIMTLLGALFPKHCSILLLIITPQGRYMSAIL